MSDLEQNLTIGKVRLVQDGVHAVQAPVGLTPSGLLRYLTTEADALVREAARDGLGPEACHLYVHPVDMRKLVAWYMEGRR